MEVGRIGRRKRGGGGAERRERDGDGGEGKEKEREGGLVPEIESVLLGQLEWRMCTVCEFVVLPSCAAWNCD